LLEPGGVSGRRGTGDGRLEPRFGEAAKMGFITWGCRARTTVTAGFGGVVASAGGGAFTNLITSGVGLTKKRAEECARRAGFGAIELSIGRAAQADAIAGAVCISKSWRWRRDPRRGHSVQPERGVASREHGAVAGIIDVAEKLGATRWNCERAVYGWRLRIERNCCRRETGEAAMQIALAEKKRLADKMEFFMCCDYTRASKPCMNAGAGVI